MMPIMVWLLPEPLSPTIASVSPDLTSRSMPLTASTAPSGVSKVTFRSRTARMVSADMSAVLRVERIAQAVAGKVQGKQRRNKKDRREDQEPGRRLDVVGTFGNQRAPACQRCLNTETEEGQ